MENKRKRSSLFFKGTVIALALAFTILCFPFNVIALASADLSSTDYTYMTIESVSGQETTVTKGATYKIANGLIGGNSEAVIGKVAANSELADEVILKSSNVTVTYSSVVIGAISNGTAAGDVTVSSEEGVVGTFDAVKEGNYTVTYSYTYEDASNNTYTNKYSVKVSTELSSASISVVSNTEKFLPSIIDLKQKTGDFSVYIPAVEIKDENGDVVENYTLTNSKAEAVADKSEGARYVVVSVVASNGNAVALEKDTTTGLYKFESSVFADTNFGAGKYTVTYSYYEEGNFITSVQKTTKVYATDNAYYKNYDLKLNLASAWSNNGETGVETALPKAQGKTASTTTPASEDVDTYYTVKVYYKSSGAYQVIDAEQYNEAYNKANGITDKESADYETIINEDGTLVNAEKFKPLKDGNYSFVYTVYDFYGNSDANTVGLYEWTEVEDKTKPTPVVYDASIYGEDDEYVDESDKLAYYVKPGEVVLYAIGMKDNVSKATDEGVVLERKILSGSTTVVSIKEYNNKNLVFNYGSYTTLQANNYLIRKATTEVSSDEDMRVYLKDNGYMIVVDNANYKNIYTTFESFIGADKTDAQKLEYFKSEEAKTAGFAYIDMDSTFGSKTSSETTSKGVGTGLYYVHYIATDAAENTTDVTKNVNIYDFIDTEAPTVKISTDSFKNSYANGDKITFDVPTASKTNNYDSRLSVKTLYRYFDGTEVVGEGIDFEEVYNDLSDADKTKYASYQGDGYVDITDKDLTKYEITVDSTTATKIQIISYCYDDSGNVGMNAVEFSIENVTDEKAPKLETVTAGTTTATQGEEVTLPTIEVLDDKVEFLTYDVEVIYTDGEGNETIISSYGDKATKDVTSLSGFGSYTVNAGKFIGAFAGDYQVRISVSDLNNNTVVSYSNVKVEAREVIQNPVIGTTLSSKTIELDDKETIEIPVPTINYELSNSVTYDVFVENGNETDKDYIVLGVDKNGKATKYSTNGPEGKYSFAPSKIGTYEIQYTANVQIYNKNKFEYVEGSAETYTKGGYFNLLGTSKTVSVENDVIICGEYKLSKDEDGNAVIEYNNNKYTFIDGKYYDENGAVVSSPISDSEIANMPQWLSDLRVYTLTTDVYTIKVQDTKGPTVNDSTFNYSDQEYMTVEQFQENGIKVLPIEATDASDIDGTKSQVTVSYKRANGTSSGSTGSETYTGERAMSGFTYTDETATRIDGTYTITYKIYDNNGNYTTKAYTIAVGDNEEPVVVIDEDAFVESSYEIGSQLVIDSSLIDATDNITAKENLTTTIKLVNTSTSKEVEYTVDGTKYVFNEFDTVGKYTLTIEVEDEVGHVATKTFNIDVTEKSKDSVEVYKIVGIVLIVISVLVLAGVIVYFIVSKVKLDKELKK